MTMTRTDSNGKTSSRSRRALLLPLAFIFALTTHTWRDSALADDTPEADKTVAESPTPAEKEAGHQTQHTITKEETANKKLIAIPAALKKGDWAFIISTAPEILAVKPELAPKLAPLLAYAYHKNNDKERALEALKGEGDLFSRLVRASITGEVFIPPGTKEAVKNPDIFHVDVGVPVSDGYEDAVYKKSLIKGLKEAFLRNVKESSPATDAFYEERIAPYADKYYLGHYTLVQDETGEGYYTFNVIIFIDSGAVKEASGPLTGNAGSEGHLKTVLLAKGSSDAVKKRLLKDLMDAGYAVEDLGSGDLTPETIGRTKGAIVVQVVEDAAITGKVLNSNFKTIRANLDFIILNGNNGLVISKLNKTQTLVHLNEDEGKGLATNRAYEKALKPLKEAITDIEVRMGKEITAGLLPPIEATLMDTKEVFASIYKSYSNDPVSTLLIKNNGNNVYKSVRAAFSVKGYMDYPTEVKLDRLGPKEEKAVPLKAVFNTKILDLTDNSLLQSETEVSYTENNGADKSIKIRQPIQVYEKQALVWDNKGKIATFLTYKDPVVSGFATKAAREFNYPYLNQSIVMARAVFGAMGVLGITYVPDPTPYATVASVTTMIDRVQYPRQTLARKAGDCDDLVSLFGASLESLGIKVMPIEAPTHLFIMFDTGIPVSEERESGFPEGNYIVYDDTLWLPFETTLVGSSFFLAWEKGAENYRIWKKEARFINPREAWKTYAPATLPYDEFTQNISMAAIEKKFPGELESLKKKKVENIVGRLAKEKGASVKRKNIVLYGKNNMIAEALKLTDELLKNAPRDAELLNNAGNLHYMQGGFEKALASYMEAAKITPDDAGVWVNIARAHLKMGLTSKAVEAFDKAQSLDKDVKERYLRLHTEIRK